jgi:hypothetical protein
VIAKALISNGGRERGRWKNCSFCELLKCKKNATHLANGERLLIGII